MNIRKALLPFSFLLAYSGLASATPAPEPVQKFAELLKQQYSLPYQINPVESGEDYWQITMGSNIVFISKDGRYVINGDFFNTVSGVNYTEMARFSMNSEALKKIDPSAMVTFKAQNESEQIWVFSDTHCPHCKQFHTQVPQLNANGVTVNYILFPLQGKMSKGFNTNTAIICDANPQQRLNDVFSTGQHLAANSSCQEKASTLLNTAASLGVNSTPTIVLSNGFMLKGGYSAQEILAVIQKIKGG